MRPHNHPDTSTLVAYAAGAVNEAFSLVLAAHMESCDKCRAAVSQAEAVGGGFMEHLPAAEMAHEGMAHIWERIAAAPAVQPVSSPPQHNSGVPAVLSPYLPDGLQAVQWRTLVPGIRQHLLEDVDSGQGSIRLLSIAPGTPIPHHTHLGSELTLVLQGSYSDETGYYRPGDLADVDSTVHHSPVVDSEDPCICLVATDQRLQFTGTLNRMLQPFLGI